MRSFFGIMIFVLLLWSAKAWAVVAFLNHGGSASIIDTSFDFTPSGTARGVLCAYIIENTGADTVTAMTADLVPMVEVSGSPVLHPTGEVSAVHVFFLGSSIPAGTLTIAATASGSPEGRIRCLAVSAAANTEVVATNKTTSDSISGVSFALSLGGRTSFVAIFFMSGEAAVASVTPLAGWTSQAEGTGGGVGVEGLYTYNTIASADVTCGMTQSSDDIATMCIAISEVSAVLPRQRSLLGVGS